MIYDTNINIFVNNLSNILEKKGISNNSFYKYCDISVGFFYRLLKGENARFKFYVRIAEALNLPLCLLFYDQDDNDMLLGIVDENLNLKQAIKNIINDECYDDDVSIINVTEESVASDVEMYLNYCIEQINNILKQKSLTKLELATGMGASDSYINKLLKRKQMPSLEMISQIATFLDVKIFDLLNVPEKFQKGVSLRQKRVAIRVQQI